MGADYIRRTLEVTRYVYDETVKGMNAGRSVHQLMAEIELPTELRISEGHGKVSWSVRAIWELLAGWFYFRDAANLYPVPPKRSRPTSSSSPAAPLRSSIALAWERTQRGRPSRRRARLLAFVP